MDYKGSVNRMNSKIKTDKLARTFANITLRGTFYGLKGYNILSNTFY